MEIKTVEITKPSEDVNVIVGQTHFIKSAEDIYEAIITSVPGARFAVAFNEASGKRLIRYEGNDDELLKFTIENAEKVGAGHFFIVMLRNVYPINVLNRLRETQEVVSIFAATANPLKIIVAIEGDSRGIIGVMDGQSPVGVENENDRRERKEFLRKIGYKL